LGKGLQDEKIERALEIILRHGECPLDNKGRRSLLPPSLVVKGSHPLEKGQKVTWIRDDGTRAGVRSLYYSVYALTTVTVPSDLLDFHVIAEAGEDHVQPAR